MSTGPRPSNPQSMRPGSLLVPDLYKKLTPPSPVRKPFMTSDLQNQERSWAPTLGVFLPRSPGDMGLMGGSGSSPFLVNQENMGFLARPKPKNRFSDLSQPKLTRSAHFQDVPHMTQVGYGYHTDLGLTREGRVLEMCDNQGPSENFRKIEVWVSGFPGSP